MTTFAQVLVDSLDTKWAEINLLIAEAESKANNIDLYNALCRSVSVLMVAQFEAFMRDTAKAILDDINEFSSFSNAPSALKQTFCRSFLVEEADGKDSYGRLQRLISTFDGLDTKFTHEPFLVKNANDYGKNPSPSVIDKITVKFGIPRFFSVIDGSDLDDVFSDTAPEIEKLKSRIKAHVTKGVKEYPYKLDSSTFNINVSALKTSPSSSKKPTIWTAFLDNVLDQRHGIAHGSISNNPNSVEEIRNGLAKLEILQLAIVLVVCENVI